VEKNAKEWSDKLPAELNAKLDASVERARKALRGDDLNEIKAAQEELSKSFGEAGQSFYAQNQAAEGAANSGAEQPSGQQADGAGSAKPADDVVEADYEIVDDKK